MGSKDRGTLALAAIACLVAAVLGAMLMWASSL